MSTTYEHTSNVEAGDVVLIRVGVGDLTHVGIDYIPAEVLTVLEDKVEVVLFSVSRNAHWMAPDRLFLKVVR